MCKVSIIIPNYNHERFLEKRLESILNQIFQDFDGVLDSAGVAQKKRLIILRLNTV
jgi:GT2 family glycosyltransferase